MVSDTLHCWAPRNEIMGAGDPLVGPGHWSGRRRAPARADRERRAQLGEVAGGRGSDDAAGAVVAHADHGREVQVAWLGHGLVRSGAAGAGGGSRAAMAGA